jgi:hypothetical protein
VWAYALGMQSLPFNFVGGAFPHLEGAVPPPSGGVNGNIKSLLRRGRGYKNLRYLLLKAQRMVATRTEFVVFEKAA